MKNRLQKGLFAIVLVFGIAASVCFSGLADFREIMGDINGDGHYTAADVLYLRRHVVGYPNQIFNNNESIADLNRDGKINGKDVLLMRMLVAELIEVEDLPGAADQTTTTRREWTDRY